MIRKFLICGKQPFLSSRNAEATAAPVVELLLPVALFWDVQELIKKIEYMMAAGEDPVVVHEFHMRIYDKLAKYAVNEKDRVMLAMRSSSGAANDG